MISGQRMRARIGVIPLEAGYPPLGGFHDTESYMHLPARRCSIHTPRTRWDGKKRRMQVLGEIQGQRGASEPHVELEVV